LLQLGQSKSPIVNSVLFPVLSGRPAIFQLFLGLATSAPQFLHLAIHLPPSNINIHDLFMLNKRFAFKFATKRLGDPRDSSLLLAVLVHKGYITDKSSRKLS